ncbi:hypothetical protein SCANM63S_02339 [Streptomyces canarius]
MVQRAVRERGNPQADVLVTLPPFIQQAAGKGLLQTYAPAGADQVAGADKAPDGTWTSVVNNYFGFVYNKKELKRGPTRRSPAPSTPPWSARPTRSPAAARPS